MTGPDQPHRRRDPLADRWVLVSPQRTDRPWQGQQEEVPQVVRPAHDPECYLCPGNERVGGQQNPDYGGTWWFPNDFPALTEDVGGAADAAAAAGGEAGSPGARMLQAEAVTGVCRVLCFDPRHDLTLARASAGQVRSVVDLWADQVDELGREWAHVQVFENRGTAMGASNPHPHGQLWATSVVPHKVATEDRTQREHWEGHGRPLLQDALDAEVADGDRVVVAGDHFVAVVPYWAIWPFEALILPRRRVARMPELSGGERDDLAVVLKELLVRYDNLFGTPFPYSMGWHGAPGHADDGTDVDHWQLHGHVYPPLLRSATVRKFMVGFEMLAEEQRDITAEQAAQRLRDVSDVHYRDQAGSTQ